jgi:hypothetical protein
MWKIARTLFDIAHALMRLAIEIVELDRRERQRMTDAISELEGAQDARDTTDADLQTALAAELDRVKVDTQHLIDEIGAGAGNTDPARLMRVAQRIADGNAKVRAVVDQLNAEDPVPDFPAAPAPSDQPSEAPADQAPSETPSA